MHQVLYGLPVGLEPDVVSREDQVQNIHQVANVAELPRQIMPLSSFEELEQNQELEKGFSKEMAQKEAQRCLQCGLICYAREKEAADDA